MKDLRKALHEGPKQALISASHLPHRHPFAFAAFIGGLVIAYLFIWQYSTQKQVDVLRPQVTEIVEAVSACQPPVPKERHAVCIARIEAGLKACRRDASCRAAFGDVLTPPPPRRESGSSDDAAVPGGDAFQPSTGNQQPGPRGDGGDQDGGEDRGDPRPPKAPPGTQAAPPEPEGSAPPPEVDQERGEETKQVKPPAEPPGLVEGVTGTAAGAIDQAGKDVERTVDEATCNPVVSLCP